MMCCSTRIRKFARLIYDIPLKYKEVCYLAEVQGGTIGLMQYWLLKYKESRVQQ